MFVFFFFLFKQKTAYEMRISDWSSDVCSSDLVCELLSVATGQARHVLCFRALTESSSQTATRRASIPGAGRARLGGWYSYLVPANAMSASNWAGWMATRYCHEFGMTREHLGMVATGQRAFAQHNPSAVMQAPLTMEDYLGARMISSPLGLFDCDGPIDGACVVIVSAERQSVV